MFPKVTVKFSTATAHKNAKDPTFCELLGN